MRDSVHDCAEYYKQQIQKRRRAGDIFRLNYCRSLKQLDAEAGNYFAFSRPPVLEGKTKPTIRNKKEVWGLTRRTPVIYRAVAGIK